MRFALLLAIASAVIAQDSKVEFEAATVKINTDTTAGAYLSGGPGSNDPSLLTCVRLRIGTLVRLAFRINSSYEYSMPSGLPDVLYDIRAKIPPGTDQARFEQMLQNLLIERFGMKVHRETREVAGYELTIAKGGSKLRPEEIPSIPPDLTSAQHRHDPMQDRDGEPMLKPGMKTHIVYRLHDGPFRHSARGLKMEEIVALASHELGKPILDHSGLSGSYDFNIDFMRSPDDPSERMDEKDTPFLTAFQAQLGLRLESKKVPVEVIVIDHIEKTPTAN